MKWTYEWEIEQETLVVETYGLTFPLWLILKLDNYYSVQLFVIISISCLDKKCFKILIKDKCCSSYLNDVFYASAPMCNGIYVLDLNMPIYNINTKRVKPNDLNPTYLWHYRLGHIGEECISKFHKDSLLDSFDVESFDVCGSCPLGKMTRTSFIGQDERASDLLGLIYSDVCGPLSKHVRGGYPYFI